MLKTGLANQQHERARKDFIKNHETSLPSTCMHEKDDKLEFQANNTNIPNDPDTAHDTTKMEEEELVQEEVNDEKKN